MKTPIQELIEQVEEWMLYDKYVQDNPLDYKEYMVMHANQMIKVKGEFIDMCKAMLEKEKSTTIGFATRFSHKEYTLSYITKEFEKTFNTKEQ